MGEIENDEPASGLDSGALSVNDSDADDDGEAEDNDEVAAGQPIDVIERPPMAPAAIAAGLPPRPAVVIGFTPVGPASLASKGVASGGPAIATGAMAMASPMAPSTSSGGPDTPEATAVDPMFALPASNMGTRQAVLAKEFAQLVGTEPPFVSIVRRLQATRAGGAAWDACLTVPRERNHRMRPWRRGRGCTTRAGPPAQRHSRLLLDARALRGVCDVGERVRQLSAQLPEPRAAQVCRDVAATVGSAVRTHDQGPYLALCCG